MMDSESRQNAKTKLENMKYSSGHGILKVDDKWLDNGKFIISKYSKYYGPNRCN